jgi:hypothetical protein
MNRNCTPSTSPVRAAHICRYHRRGRPESVPHLNGPGDCRGDTTTAKWSILKERSRDARKKRPGMLREENSCGVCFVGETAKSQARNRSAAVVSVHCERT